MSLAAEAERYGRGGVGFVETLPLEITTVSELEL